MKPYNELTRLGQLRRIRQLAEAALDAYGLNGARRGLGKAVLTEGMRRLQEMGCTRLLANGYDPPADALYGSVLGTKEDSVTWFKGL